MRLLHEGPDIQVLLGEIRAQHGPAAKIVKAERVRTGGIAGFFAKQHFEVTLDVADDAAPTGTAFVKPQTAMTQINGSGTAHTGALPSQRTAGSGLDALIAAAEEQDLAPAVGGRPLATSELIYQAPAGSGSDAFSTVLAKVGEWEEAAARRQEPPVAPAGTDAGTGTDEELLFDPALIQDLSQAAMGRSWKALDAPSSTVPHNGSAPAPTQEPAATSTAQVFEPQPAPAQSLPQAEPVTTPQPTPATHGASDAQVWEPHVLAGEELTATRIGRRHQTPDAAPAQQTETAAAAASPLSDLSSLAGPTSLAAPDSQADLSPAPAQAPATPVADRLASPAPAASPTTAPFAPTGAIVTDSAQWAAAAAAFTQSQAAANQLADGGTGDVLPPPRTRRERRERLAQQAESSVVLRRLVELGVPQRFLTNLPSDPTTADVASALAGLPRASSSRPDEGEVIAILVEPGEADAVGSRISRRWRMERSHVAGGSGATRLSGDKQAARLAAKARESGQAQLMVLDAELNGFDAEWAGDILTAARPDRVLAVVDATRKPHDIDSWLTAITPMVDAIVLVNTSSTATPAAVLSLGIPVAEVDGRPGTAAEWATLLMSRVFESAQ